MRAWKPSTALISAVAATLLAAAGVVLSLEARQAPVASAAPPGPSAPSLSAPHLALVEEYCVTCHDEEEKKGGLALDLISADVAEHQESREKVVRKLRARQMPPVGRKERPDEATYDATVSYLETALDRAAAAHPNPGRTATIRRLTRTEYQNAIRDLLALRRRCRLASARRRIQLRLRQRDGRRSLADAARPLHLGGGKDQPRGRRPSQPFSRRRDHQDAAGPDAGGHISRACRSALAAARSSTTPFRWTASTRFRFG